MSAVGLYAVCLKFSTFELVNFISSEEFKSPHRKGGGFKKKEFSIPLLDLVFNVYKSFPVISLVF